jgi:hypothetical protein
MHLKFSYHDNIFSSLHNFLQTICQKLIRVGIQILIRNRIRTQMFSTVVFGSGQNRPDSQHSYTRYILILNYNH